MADWHRNEDERRARGYGGGDDQGYRQQGRSQGQHRGMMERGSDEVRSWLGDDEAERRRQRDSQRDARGEGQEMRRQREGGSRSPSWQDIGDGDGEDSDFRESRERGRGGQSASSFRPTTFTYTEIWAIPGPYAGQGPRGYQRSDDRIKEDVCECLTQHGNVDASNIEVSVSNGEVTLRGNVTNRDMKRRAEHAIEFIPGVQDVRNELKAAPQNSHGNQNSPGQGEKNSENEKRDTSKQERNRVPS